MIKILDFLSQKAIIPTLEATTKEDAIREMVDKLVNTGEINDADKVINVLLEREKLGSTGIGEGVAIPHGKSDAVENVVALFARSEKGVAFDALDGEPVYLLFLLIAPTTQEAISSHLKVLARVSRLLKDVYFRKALRNAETTEEIVRIIETEELK